MSLSPDARAKTAQSAALDCSSSSASIDRRRRRLIEVAAASALAGSLTGCETTSVSAVRHGPPRVIVVGGGIGGATAAALLKREAGEGLEVVLIEREPRHTSTLLSNAVLGGWRQFDELTHHYDGLRRLGVRVLHDQVVAIDAQNVEVRLADGATLDANRLIVACGVEPASDQIEGFDAGVQALVLHGWQQTRQIDALRQRLVRVPARGSVLLSIPRGPVSGQLAPYERACQFATWLRAHRPRSRLLVLDANPAMPQAAEVFHRVFRDRFAGLLDYRPHSAVVEVGPDARFVVLESGERLSADLMNVIPPSRALALVREAGLATADGLWADVSWPTMASRVAPNVHLIGDAVASPPGMAKSAGTAAAQARWAATAILEALDLRRPDDPPRGPEPIVARQFAFIDSRSAVQVTTVHRLSGVDGRWSITQQVPAGSVMDDGQALQPGVRGPGDSDGVAALAWTRKLWKDAFET